MQSQDSGIAKITRFPVGKSHCKNSSPSLGLSVSRSSNNTNLAPSKVTAISTSPERAINVWDLDSTSLICAEKARCSPSVLNVLTNSVSPSSNHPCKTKKASLDEISFIGCVTSFGPAKAIYLAGKFQWKCQRPLRALRAMMSELGRTYTKRSAKTRPRSGRAEKP